MCINCNNDCIEKINTDCIIYSGEATTCIEGGDNLSSIIQSIDEKLKPLCDDLVLKNSVVLNIKDLQSECLPLNLKYKIEKLPSNNYNFVITEFSENTFYQAKVIRNGELIGTVVFSTLVNTFTINKSYLDADGVIIALQIVKNDGLGVSVYNKTIAVNGVTSLGEYSTSLGCVENDFVEMSLQTALQMLVNEISLLKGKIDAL